MLKLMRIIELKLFKIAILCLSIMGGTLHAFVQEERVPGGIAILHFDSKPTFLDPSKKYCLIPNANTWTALIPIPLATKKNVKLSYRCDGHVFHTVIKVGHKAYKKQYITLKDTSKVSPKKRDEKRIIREIKSRTLNLNRHSKFVPKSFKMIKPLDARLKDDFGRQRFFNNKPRSPHSGMDLSMPKGSKIKVALAGRVILLGNLYFNGRMVLIDHGQGLISAYSHLSKIYYPNGTWLEQGAYLGEVGQSGRATGPHLHWSVYLNGTAVNPELFL